MDVATRVPRATNDLETHYKWLEADVSACSYTKRSRNSLETEDKAGSLWMLLHEYADDLIETHY